jgi:hypothetical protein
VNDEFERILMETGHSLIQLLPRDLPGGTEKTHKNPHHDSWFLLWESNRVPPIYESRALCNSARYAFHHDARGVVK